MMRPALLAATVVAATVTVLTWASVRIVHAASEAGDPASGRHVFQKRCSGCHALNENREGPHLAGVVGRKAGSLPDFAYSDTLRMANWTWDEISLNRWLSDTDAMAPGSNMGFRVPSSQERLDVIAFLKTTR